MLVMVADVTLRTGFLLAGFLAAVAALHAYWALGGRWGLQTAVGEGNPLPPAPVIWVVVFGLIAALLVVLGQIGLWGRAVPEWVFRWGTWALCIVLVAVAVLNFAAGSTWEMLVFAPFTAVLALLAAVVASARRAV
jgi:hypothetical protein